MQPKWSWFDRTFDFNFPAEKLPDIAERLRGTPDRIARLTSGIDQGILQMRETDDSWSVKENIGHLCDLEPLWAGRIEDIVDGKQTLRATDLTNKITFDQQHNQQTIEILTARFTDLRQHLLQSIQRLNQDSWSKSAIHPRLETSMRVVDLCEFVADHDDYHLARARYLLGLLSR